MINKIEISGFRGIKSELKLSFADSKIILLFGENGSGKSSIIDAIEFCLQKRVSHIYDSTQKDMLKQVINYTSKVEDTKVRVILSGEKYPELTGGKQLEARTIVNRGNDLYAFSPIEDCPKFSAAPIVIRRDDITNWWDLSVEDKKRFVENRFKQIEREYKKTETEGDPSEIFNNTLLKITNEFPSFSKEIHAINHNTSNNDITLILDSIKKQLSHSIAPSLIGRYKGTLLKTKKKIENGTGYTKSKIDLIEELTTGIKEEVRKIFLELKSGSTPVEDVNFNNFNDIKIKIKNDCNEGNLWVDPQNYLSEANRDILVLSMYLGMVRFAADNWNHTKVLILDDVFQSVDAEVRLKSTRFVMKKFKDFQLLFSTHDRFWMDQLSNLTNNSNKIYIKDWSQDYGPILYSSIETNEWNPLILLKNKIQCKNESLLIPREIGYHAGYALEYLCENISYKMNSNIKRKEKDKYTLGDLFEPVMKSLSDFIDQELIDNLRSFLQIRNISDHALSFYSALQMSEAKQFAELVINLYEKLYCSGCGYFVKRFEKWKNETLECSCGRLRLSKHEKIKAHR